MESLKNIQTGTLYNPDKTFLTKIRFTTPNRDSAVFLFSEKPEKPLPEFVLLVPDATDDEEADDFIAYRYFLSGEWISYKLLGTPCFLMNGSMNASQNLRQDLRVKVSFEIEAVFDSTVTNKILTVKDISAGASFLCPKSLSSRVQGSPLY